jgi:hypothetical protein
MGLSRPDRKLNVRMSSPLRNPNRRRSLMTVLPARHARRDGQRRAWVLGAGALFELGDSVIDVMTNLHFWVALFLAGRRLTSTVRPTPLFGDVEGTISDPKQTRNRESSGDQTISDRKSFLLGHSFFQAAPRQKALIASGACRCF